MSTNNINIQELERQFDALLLSFSDEEIKEWYRFDIEQDKLEKFLSGEFQPTELIEVVSSTAVSRDIPVIEIEVFDYILDQAC